MPDFHVIAAGGGYSAELDVRANDAATAACEAVTRVAEQGVVEVTHLLVRRIGDADVPGPRESHSG